MTERPFARLAARFFPGATLQAVRRLHGGVSADVHCLELRDAGGGIRRVVVRAHGAAHDGHGAELEFQLLDALYGAGLPVPAPLAVDASGTVLPDPFLVLEFVEGTSNIPDREVDQRIDAMAGSLATIHSTPTGALPPLPERLDPLPEVLDYLPEGPEWTALRQYLAGREGTRYVGPACLLHGDYWPENLLWASGEIRAVLDWEDAALGDPLSDVAIARVELRYLFGRDGMRRFTEAYARHREVPTGRLALWQVYVAAAAQRFMGGWGLPEARVAHMRREALASVREAGAHLLHGDPL